MGRKLNKSQRRAFARLCYFSFFQLNNMVSVGVRRDRWFLESCTDEEIQELQKLMNLTNKLAERWRTFAWKLDGNAAE